MAPVPAQRTWSSSSIIPSSHLSSSFWSCPSSKDESIVDREMIPLTFWGATLESSCLWTSWAHLVTDGHMESPLGPQPIRSCSCSQRATSPCRSHSGPKGPEVSDWRPACSAVSSPRSSCTRGKGTHSISGPVSPAFVLLIGGFEVGLAYFPFFACLSSEFRLVSSTLGFCYSLIWFAVTILQVSQCPHGPFLGSYESVMFYWPSLLCLAFLLGRFLHMFAKALRVHLGWERGAEEQPVLEAHQAAHVQRLLRTPRPQDGKTTWFQARIYEWDPCFRFPSRMIGTIVLAFICLYLESGC
ncbi:stimulated by retinoic acid gene 6 protein-like [Otolemur garnettii]|uniref:stimulated by retinoic acid gene 6 protein-like n=1 Tax=Otolemur garnettii TaxID=30611 RepID=UPI000C7F4895|nr:stimulated by retinoic acid gene 6 protein-like [Otolemur garnettii]